MTRREDIYRENYESLLLGYAAGVLDMAQNFIIAAHLALSPEARRLVRECETIGGCLIEGQCPPAAMREESLHNVLGRLEEPRAAKQAKRPPVKLPEDVVGIPPHVLELLSCRPCRPRWRSFHPGLQMCELPIECEKSGVRFIRARPAAKMPHHIHRGMEITLVLDGAYDDESGPHRRGDLAIIDEGAERRTVACRDRGVVAVVVSSAPVRFTGLAALLNPFIRF